MIVAAISPKYRIWTFCALAVSIGVGQAPAAAADPFARARDQLVRTAIIPAGIRDRRVIQSIRVTPRHEFMDPSKRELAYFDMAVPIGHGQTISPPYIVAFMTAQLEPQPTDRVLEIGTGSGYQAAVLSPLVKEVYTIEIVEPLGIKAAETLKRLNYTNVFPKIGDGYLGWPEKAPFDKIIVTCSPESIPKPLVEQLADGGQIIIPVGERFQQTLCRFRKHNGELKREPLQETFFVPMTGESEAQRKVTPDKTQPTIVNGSFEEKLGDTDDPAGWYYVRQAAVTQLDSAPDKDHILLFRNATMGRSAHALQAIGVDGLLVGELELRVDFRCMNIRPGRQKDEVARVLIEFYNENRTPVGQALIGPWRGSTGWRQAVQKVKVPQTAQLAVVGVGLFGATGQLAVDRFEISVVESDATPSNNP